MKIERYSLYIIYDTISVNWLIYDDKFKQTLFIKNLKKWIIIIEKAIIVIAIIFVCPAIAIIVKTVIISSIYWCFEIFYNTVKRVNNIPFQLSCNGHV